MSVSVSVLLEMVSLSCRSCWLFSVSSVVDDGVNDGVDELKRNRNTAFLPVSVLQQFCLLWTDGGLLLLRSFLSVSVSLSLAGSSQSRNGWCCRITMSVSVYLSLVGGVGVVVVVGLLPVLSTSVYLSHSLVSVSVSVLLSVFSVSVFSWEATKRECCRGRSDGTMG